jgi:hypothetical protein
MVTILKPGTTKKNIRLLLKRIKDAQTNNRIDAYKYCGTIKLQLDAVTIQRKMRDEWE